MTMNDTTLAKVQAWCAEMSGRPAPEPDQQLYYDASKTNDQAHIAAGGYGFDSLDGVELMMEIEEQTGLEISDKVAESDAFKTAGGIAAWIDAQNEEG